MRSVVMLQGRGYANLFSLTKKGLDERVLAQGHVMLDTSTPSWLRRSSLQPFSSSDIKPGTLEMGSRPQLLYLVALSSRRSTHKRSFEFSWNEVSLHFTSGCVPIHSNSA
eukprot:6492341-Amphidinium_carterae.1